MKAKMLKEALLLCSVVFLADSYSYQNNYDFYEEDISNSTGDISFQFLKNLSEDGARIVESVIVTFHQRGGVQTTTLKQVTENIFGPTPIFLIPGSVNQLEFIYGFAREVINYNTPPSAVVGLQINFLPGDDEGNIIKGLAVAYYLAYVLEESLYASSRTVIALHEGNLIPAILGSLAPEELTYVYGIDPKMYKNKFSQFNLRQNAAKLVQTYNIEQKIDTYGHRNFYIYNSENAPLFIQHHLNLPNGIATFCPDFYYYMKGMCRDFPKVPLWNNIIDERMPVGNYFLQYTNTPVYNPL